MRDRFAASNINGPKNGAAGWGGIGPGAARTELTYYGNNLWQTQSCHVNNRVSIQFANPGANNQQNIPSLFVYMDDFFGWDFLDNLVFYHGLLRPRCQEHGVTLKIIGFWVDAALGSISLSPESVTDIIAKVTTFLTAPGRQRPLRDWQKLGGLLNWMLNVLPVKIDIFFLELVAILCAVHHTATLPNPPR
ncbi:hypothetical protein B0H10DRAFT_2244494 [Mycena sp. CBHHK59/15]|nr:hypothetical protein B0H10DRAFT_2244494 [Mycena sp. CBHHK59/15]